MQLASRRGLATLLLLAGALQARALQAGAWPAPAPQRSRRAGAPVLQQPPIGAEPGSGGAAAAEPAGSSVVALAPSLPPARGPASGEWQLDFYSRPVQGADGKKLWELLVTDSAGSFYHAEAVPSNCVNSRELRKRVQALIDASAVKPRAIRFFRAQARHAARHVCRSGRALSLTPPRSRLAPRPSPCPSASPLANRPSTRPSAAQRLPSPLPLRR